MKCRFQVGQKVVCITVEWHTVFDAVGAEKDAVAPQFGEICKIASMREGQADDDIYLHFVGFNDGYVHTGFRPLQERPTKTDIGILKAILKGKIKVDLEPAS